MERSITQMSNNRARLISRAKKIACNNRQSEAAENSRSGAEKAPTGIRKMRSINRSSEAR